MFNIVWSRLMSWLLPWFLRRVKHTDWLNALLKPLSELHQMFLSFKDQTLYDLSITGQVIYVEMMLNDIFNGGIDAWVWNGSNYTYTPNTPTAIYIIDNPNYITATPLWTTEENRPPVVLWRSEDLSTSLFQVNDVTVSGTWTATIGSISLLAAPITLPVATKEATVATIVAAINSYSATSGCYAGATPATFSGYAGFTLVVTTSAASVANGTMPMQFYTAYFTSQASVLVAVTPYILWTDEELNSQADFVVMVPSTLANVSTNVTFISQMKAWINKYRQAGSRYTIVNY